MIERTLLLSLTAAAVVLSAAAPVAAVEPSVPIEVRVLVDDSDAASTAQVTLTLDFSPTEDIEQGFTVGLRLRHLGNPVLQLDHVPARPTKTWKKGEVITYTLPAPVPLGDELSGPRRLTVHLGFIDAETGKTHPPQGRPSDPYGFARVADFDLPELDDVGGDDVQPVLDAAKQLAADGRSAAAWRALVAGIRRAEEDTDKYRFRDAMLALGDVAAAPISVVEREIVDGRIADEKRRYMRQMSGRFFNRKQYHATLLILEAIGGSLEEDADKAVLGAVNDVKRIEKDRWDIRDKIIEQLTDEQKAAADEMIDKHGPTKKLLDLGLRWFAEKRYPEARRVLNELSFAEIKELRDAAQEARSNLDKAWVADVPPEQRQAVDDVVSHAAWGRTDTLATQEFILIGPRGLIESIPAQSRRNFDVAYVFLTDLFGRKPNPAGDRVTVYFKELWEFAGGTGGGKQINIGRADPEKRGTRLDTGLLYHELTHCVDDTNPVLGGWREGLANVGAAYTYEALDQRADLGHSFESNLRDFRNDYLARDLAYWRIPNYGPSAGFFLHFVRTYAKTNEGHDWKGLRGFFRDYRKAPVRDGRTTYVARAVAYFLVKHFGKGAFDDLVAFRLPLVESDRAAIELEFDAWDTGVREVFDHEEEFGAYENSPLYRDLITRRMLADAKAGKSSEARRVSREELGILHDWRVIGPFAQESTDPGACVFPPQYEVDFEKEYQGKGNICRWRKVTDPGPVSIEPTGWVSIKYPYMDQTATYALTHVTVEQETPVAFHVRADDDFTLVVNGQLVEALRNKGGNSSSNFDWRGPRENVPDALRMHFTLRAGRNRILLKIRNHGGPAGFALAVSRPDGHAIPGLLSDDGPVDGPLAPEIPTKWKTVAKHEFKTKAYSPKVDVTAGRFVIKNKLLQGATTDKGVEWRKFTVTPGVEKDNPSNMMWLKDKFTSDVDEFRLTMDLVLPLEQAPKMVVTFQGDGKKDGLSGWNLILHGGGTKVLRAELERYQRLFHQAPPLEMEEAEARKLVLTYVDQRLTVTLGTLTVFDAVPVRPIAGARRIGFCTWGPEPSIAAFELEVPR